MDFSDLHISHNVARLIKKEKHRLELNTCTEEVITSIQNAHENCWMMGEYAELMVQLSKNSYNDFNLFSTELFDDATGLLIAGEIGYITRSVYTSLSGFHSPDKRYRNWGTLQMVLLGDYLQREGIRFWNLGHPQMQYKRDLGAKILNRNDFLLQY